MSGLMFPKPEPRVIAKRKKKAEEEAAWRACCKVVDARDQRRCRACGRRCAPDVPDMLLRGERHHLIFRSQGGGDASQNVLLVCMECHVAIHRRELRIEVATPNGANDRIEVWRHDGAGWYLSRREKRCGELDRD